MVWATKAKMTCWARRTWKIWRKKNLLKFLYFLKNLKKYTYLKKKLPNLLLDLKVGTMWSPSKLHKFLMNLMQKVLPYKSSWGFPWRICVNHGQYLGRQRSIKWSYTHSKTLQHRYQHPEKIQKCKLILNILNLCWSSQLHFFLQIYQLKDLFMSFCTLFWDDITIIGDENCLLF